MFSFLVKVLNLSFKYCHIPFNMSPTDVEEAERGADETAVIAGVVAGGVCMIVVSPVVFALFFLDCKKYMKYIHSR